MNKVTDKYSYLFVLDWLLLHFQLILLELWLVDDLAQHIVEDYYFGEIGLAEAKRLTYLE